MKDQVTFGIDGMGVLHFIASLFSFMMLIVAGSIDNSPCWNIIIMIGGFRLLIYNSIDYILPKKIQYLDGELYCIILFLRIKIDKHKAVVMHEEIFTFKNGYPPNKGLVLYRNIGRVFKLSFKNKIRLMIDPSDKEVKNYIASLDALGVRLVEQDYW